MRAGSLLLVFLLATACASSPDRRTPADAVAFAADPAGPDVEPEVLRLPRPAGGEWLGLYLLDRKAGWLFADVVADTWEGRPAIRTEMALTLELSVGGNVVRRHAVDRRWYERRDGGRLLGFEAIRAGDGGDRHLVGRCDAERCAIRTRHPGGVEERVVPLPPETADQADPVRLAAARRGAVDTTWLDLDELELHRARHAYDGEVGGRMRVLTREGDAVEEYVTLLDARGATLEVQIGPGLVARAETEARARALGAPAEVLALTRVPLPAPLPEAPARLVLEVEGLPRGLWRDDGRQRFEALADGAVRVTIDAAGMRSEPAIDRERFLAETPSIDWRSAEVARFVADALEGVAAEPRAMAAALAQRVHERLEKVYGSSSDRASDVLRSGKGDCTEHALLFVAVARAAGVPARRVHGLAWAEGSGGPALYWHEWAEIWLDGAWIAVDPTFGQFPADASHLSLGVGLSTASTAALGRLRIRRVDAAAAPKAQGFR